MLRLPQITRRSPLVISLADDRDKHRLAIYSIRHDVYGRELRQHAENADGMLRDRLDDVNTYIVATESRSVVGFVAVTPPNAYGYSLDKSFDRTATGLRFDHGLYEVRLLTVVEAFRHTQLAALLMYAALRLVESRGATTIAAIGRLELLRLYERVGLCRRSPRAQAGAVTYELMSAEVENLRASQWESVIQRMQRSVEWRLPGVSYRIQSVITAARSGNAWGISSRASSIETRLSVPTCSTHGSTRTVCDPAFVREPAVASQDLAAHPRRLYDPDNRQHTRSTGAEHRAWCRVVGSDLSFVSTSDYALDADPDPRSDVRRIRSRAGECDRCEGSSAQVETRAAGPPRCRTADGATWTRIRLGGARESEQSHRPPRGPRSRIEALNAAHPRTRVWIDETYIDYVGSLQSLEGYAASSSQVFVCKSMSKVYALSGVRAAYLVGPERLISELRQLRPPWAVSLPAHIAACEALRATDYYEAKWQETHALREELQQGLSRLGWDVTSGCANFLLCHLPASGPRAPAVIDAARARGVFIRNVESMGTSLGARAVRVAVKNQATNARTLAVLAISCKRSPLAPSPDQASARQARVPRHSWMPQSRLRVGPANLS